jgi:sec-independent protein translocase protein TatA
MLNFGFSLLLIALAYALDVESFPSLAWRVGAVVKRTNEGINVPFSSQSSVKIITTNKCLLPHPSSPLTIAGRGQVANQNQRSTTVRCRLFGLGAAEVVIIAGAILFVLGPDKIKDLAKGAGETASDLKEVPKEFQKGLEEGKTEAKSRKAKTMERVPDEE